MTVKTHLGLDGRAIFALTFDGRFRLSIDGGYELVISERFTYRWTEVDPGAFTPGNGLLFELWLEVIEHASCDERGELVLVFRSGATIRVPPGEKYEAWEVCGPDGMLIVSMPGGGIADFTPPQFSG